MSTDELVAEIVAEVRERIEAGEDIDVGSVVRAHPGLARELREQFDTLARIDRAFRGATAPAADAWAASLAGRTLGGWKLVSVLGAGGMGSVFLAERGAERAAVKVVHPHLVARRGYLDRFAREAGIGRRVRHPNVVATLDSGAAEVDGREVHYLVAEFVEGRTLRALAEELGRVPEELCRHVGREVAKALAAVHAAGAVHRDLKPDNVIVTKDHVVKVMDLGVARIADESARLSQTGAFVGSVRYGAPEQFGLPRAEGAKEAIPRSPDRAKGDNIDGRADLYALGLTLYELATGRHPFEADDVRVLIRQQLTDTPRPAGEVNPQLSPFFEEVLRRLLEKDRDARFGSATALLDVLEQGESSAWWQDRAKTIRADTRRPLRRIRIPRETALYGRDGELALLRSHYVRATEGDGHVVLLEGEAGIGKSRLVDEFVGRLAQSGEDVNFLYGSYPPGGAATASGAFITAYREHLGDDEDAICAALPQTPLLVPAFAALLRGDVAPEGAESLTKDSLQSVFVHATRSCAATRTTIVLIDDLHFAPDEGRALFASLALSVPGHRILLVGTARPELDAAWVAQVARGEHVSRISLPRLGAKDLVALLRDALRSEHLAIELAGKIADKSDGNPFFVFEILRSLRDGQFLARRPDGTWTTTKLIAEIEVPGTVKDLIFARVGSLSTAERNLLDVASCAGFDFDPVLVGEVLALGRIPVLQRLASVEKSHRLVHSSGRRFVFDHHQVAEVLYAGLPEMLREEYHAALGGAIEARSGAATTEPRDLEGALCVELAEHFLRGSPCVAAGGAQGTGAVPDEGREPDSPGASQAAPRSAVRALRYLDAALTHMERSYSHDAALRLTARSLAVPGLVAGRERIPLLLRKADRLDFLGRRDAQRAALEEAIALADADGDAGMRAWVLQSLGRLHLRVSRLDEAGKTFGEALTIARAAGDRWKEFSATGNLGLVALRQGRLVEARERLERVLAFAREIGDRRVEAASMGNLGLVHHELGLVEKAREHAARYLSLARECGDRWAEANATGNLGLALLTLGRRAEAQEFEERFLALARELGDREAEARATGTLGTILEDCGRLAEALEHHERQLALAREIGDWDGEARATGTLGLVFASLGRLREAREHCERQLAASREMGNRSSEAFAMQYLAHVAEEEGDPAEAVRLYTEALALRREMGERDREATTLVSRGAHFARQGREAEARSDLAAALRHARDLSLSHIEVHATALLATLPGSDTAAALAALAAREGGIKVDLAMEIRFLLWQATHDPAHLAEAKRRLDFMVEHAPAACRESMLANVQLNREIIAAAREQGLPLAADSKQPGDERPAPSADS